MRELQEGALEGGGTEMDAIGHGGGCGRSPGHSRPWPTRAEKANWSTSLGGEWQEVPDHLAETWAAPAGRPEAAGLCGPVRGRVAQAVAKFARKGCDLLSPIDDQAGAGFGAGNQQGLGCWGPGEQVHGRGACQQAGRAMGCSRPRRPGSNLLFRWKGRRAAGSIHGLLRAATGASQATDFHRRIASGAPCLRVFHPARSASPHWRFRPPACPLRMAACLRSSQRAAAVAKAVSNGQRHL